MTILCVRAYVYGVVGALVVALGGIAGGAQTVVSTSFSTVPAFRMDANPLVIRRPARAKEPFSVTGERAAVLGQQDGSFELWLLPVKVMHEARLTARLKGYDTAIDLNAQAAEIEVRPDETTITYAHAAITVKQHMFVPRVSEDGVANAVVLFEVHAARPAELTLSFAPAMERMWPAPNFGRPSGGWTAVGTGGAYTLETDNPSFFGVVAMPNARPGELRPYQERAATTPMTMTFSYDPAKDDGSFYPLLCGISDGKGAGEAARKALLDKVVAQGAHVAEAYRGNSEYFAHFFDTRLTVTTPDKKFDEAMRWAELAMESTKVASPRGAGLAGGWAGSGDSARPGFGWFFGRDTLWSLYAVNSYGNFALSREAMDFLFAHQREDGKMMHEVSQTAELVDWVHLPYLYASADSTPLIVMQMEDYVRASGDVEYLKAHWEAIKRAYGFTRAHVTDGVYDNTQGTGWVEEWQPKMPHQEIYLAALDAQSSQAMVRLARLMGDGGLASEAGKADAVIRSRLAAYRGADGMYAFSRNIDGSFENVPSIFPTVAWWSGRMALPDADKTFEAWAGHRIATDWGTRSVATDAAIYDPISYHHGSVWPLYTGWAAMAEYRAGRGLNGYANLRANVDLTWVGDLGDVTELLSGEFYEPLGRSSAHQLWSSAMVVTPAVRGMFGIEADGLRHALHVAPQLPAAWDGAEVKHVAVGKDLFDVVMKRVGARMEVDAVSAAPAVLCLEGAAFFAGEAACGVKAEMHHRMSVALPEVEVGLGEDVVEPGARTRGIKVLSQVVTGREMRLRVEAPGGAERRLMLRRNGPGAKGLRAEGATLEGDGMAMRFGGALGAWETREVVLRW